MGDLDDICVVPQPISTGSEQHVLALLKILNELTTVSLVTANLPADSLIRDKHEVVDIAASGTGKTVLTAAFRFLYNQFRMAQTLWSRDEQIVLFFGTTSYLIPILAAKLAGKTVVLEPRGDVPLTLRLQWEQRVPNPVARLLAGSVKLLETTGYRLADAIITYTPSMADELGLERYEEKLYPNGARYIDTEQFYPRIPYDEREQVIGFLGRLDEEKGIRTLAKVAKELSENVTFVFAGDGELREWLQRELANEIEIGTVEVTGWVEYEDVPDVLSRFKLLVLLSEPTEGLPTVILESMACGTPVYATPVSGIPDIVRNGETGALIEDTKSQSVKNGISEILQQDKLTEFSQKSREMIHEEYHINAAVERYLGILKDLRSNRGEL